jgi:hypothetical protein
VEAPDLATIKDFFRFYIATSSGRIVVKPTVDSINTNAEWFFAGFTRVTGTEINEKDSPETDRREMVNREIRGTGHAGTRGLLTPEACWHQDFADTRSLLVPGLC